MLSRTLQLFSLILMHFILSHTESSTQKSFHQRSRHTSQYDFDALCKGVPELTKYVIQNNYGSTSIDFSNQIAVNLLNKSLLKFHYGVNCWDIPTDNLCPPIPGRADYIHHIADIIDYDYSQNGISNNIFNCSEIKGLDIGTGASLIYPLIGHSQYCWSFVGTETDDQSFKSANSILKLNPNFAKHIEVRHQPVATSIFKNILNPNELFDFTMCNPPFYSSLQEANLETERKWRGLGKNDKKVSSRNFGGKLTELCYPGGEVIFISDIINESNTKQSIRDNILWFTSLVSKESNLNAIYNILQKQRHLKEYFTVNMEYGNKKSRIVCWTYLTNEKRKEIILRRKELSMDHK